MLRRILFTLMIIVSTAFGAAYEQDWTNIAADVLGVVNNSLQQGYVSQDDLWYAANSNIYIPYGQQRVANQAYRTVQILQDKGNQRRYNDQQYYNNQPKGYQPQYQQPQQQYQQPQQQQRKPRFIMDANGNIRGIQY